MIISKKMEWNCLGKKTLNRRVTVEVPESLYRKIQSKSKEFHTTPTELLRQLINKHINEIVYENIF